MIEAINQPFTLYRNSGKELPPDHWATDLSFFEIEGTGKKNKGGFIFLTDSIDLTADLWCRDKTSGYYRTECEILSTIHIIDFATCRTVWEMIEALEISGINIFNDQIKSYDRIYENMGIVTLLDLLNDWHKSKVDASYVTNINRLYNNNLGRFGQNLTDDDNGPIFHELVKALDRDPGCEINAYRFREADDPRGFTYCFFNSDKLSKPEHIWVEKKPNK